MTINDQNSLACFAAIICGLFVVVEVGAKDNDMRDIGNQRELFVDHYLIDRLDNVRLVAHTPIDRGSVLMFDKPWEGLFSGYATIIKDGQTYRAYYRGKPDASPDGDNEVTCYAESTDGIHWTKPDLGLFEIDGTKNNNVVMMQAGWATHNFSPFLDTNLNVPETARYKAFGGNSPSGLIGYSSPDGIHWKKIGDGPIFDDFESDAVFDSQNVAFWSEHENSYVLYYRRLVEGVRSVARSASEDFINWSKPVLMTYSDTDSTVPSQHLYTNQTHPYFRAPHIYLATAARFMPERQVLTEEEAASIGVNPRYFNDTSDAVLLTTRGGDHYERAFMSALIAPGVGPGNWVSRTNYPVLNIVPTDEHEMSLYVNQDYAQPTAHIRRYSMRTDGVASVRAPYEGGELITKPLMFRGEALELNFATSAAGSVWVEIQDPDGQPHLGYSLEDSRELIGNEISRVMSWNGKTDVSALAGKPIRLRFVMKDADLYSLRFR